MSEENEKENILDYQTNLRLLLPSHLAQFIGRDPRTLNLLVHKDLVFGTRVYAATPSD